VVGRTGGQ
jgi:membrane protein DedA with SNARE-associated domain